MMSNCERKRRAAMWLAGRLFVLAHLTMLKRFDK